MRFAHWMREWGFELLGRRALLCRDRIWEFQFAASVVSAVLWQNLRLAGNKPFLIWVTRTEPW